MPILVRISKNLKLKLSEMAKRDHRSVNAEIEYLLERATIVVDDSPESPRSTGRNRGGSKK